MKEVLKKIKFEEKIFLTKVLIPAGLGDDHFSSQLEKSVPELSSL
jgi:hypothetical protein